MDHKTSWLWRKKSTDKVVATTKVSVDQLNKVEHEKAELESMVNELRDKLSDALSKLYAQDDLIKKHEMMAADSMSGWEDAEAKVFSLKQELDEAFSNRAASEERTVSLEVALKDCTQQLQLVRDEQEHRIHDAVMKTAEEWERSELVLKEKLEETTVMLTRACSENARLSDALLLMEESADNLSAQKAHLERDFKSVSSKLESSEKDNSSLSYEFRLLQKELEIRNEERDFNQKIADSSHKKHLESVKKVAKLEAECQRLRVLVRKRLPGPAAVAKMKSEVEILGRDGVDASRRRSSLNSSGLSHVDTSGNSGDATKISLLKEQLWTVEEENKFLKEALNKKTDELQFLKPLHSYTPSKQSQIGSPFSDIPRLQGVSGTRRKLSLSDISIEGSVNSGDSCPSALISELEQFKSGSQCVSPSGNTVGSLDKSLMDDFADVERLATVSADKQFMSHRFSIAENSALIGCRESVVNEHLSDVSCKDVVPVLDLSAETSNDTKWLRSIVNIILEQHRVTSRQLHQVLDDVRLALNTLDSSKLEENKLPGMLLQLANESSHLKVGESGDCEMRKSLCKIIDLIEGVKQCSYSVEEDEKLFSGREDAQSEDIIQAFQWKNSELKKVLEQFVKCCHDFLNGKSNCENFVLELTVTLDWVVNHSISIQDVSSMKDARNESQIESRAETAKVGKTFPINKQFESGENHDETVWSLTEEKSSGHGNVTVLGRSKSANDDPEKSIGRSIPDTGIHKLLKSEPSSRLELVKAKLSDSRLTAPSLDEESELEPKHNCQGQNQHESVKEAISVNGLHRDEKQIRTDWDITVASEKLAQCQQTIVKLGKQFKEMGSSTMEPISSPIHPDVATAATCEEAMIATGSDVVNFSPDKDQVKPEIKDQKSSLRERMMEDLRANHEETKPSGQFHRSALVSNEVIDHLERILMLDKTEASNNGSKAIVQTNRKVGVSVWKRLFWRRRRSSKKPRLPFSQ